VRGEPWIFATPTRVKRPSEPAGHEALHAVAACISAIISLGREGDPQLPYWFTFDVMGAIIEPEIRAALELFLARVALVRGGVAPISDDLIGESLETALSTLPAAVEAIAEHLAAHGAGDETLDVWDAIGAYLADPDLARALAQDLSRRRTGTAVSPRKSAAVGRRLFR
jgi:hypothetical protein